MVKFIFRAILYTIWAIIGTFGLIVGLAMALSDEYREESKIKAKEEYQKFKNRHYTKII